LPALGSYDFVVFGRSTVTGSFTAARVVRATVTGPPALVLRGGAGGNLTGFNAVGADVIFDLSSGTTGSPKSIGLSLNGAAIPATSLQIGSTSIQASKLLVEGRNDLVAIASTATGEQLYLEA